MPKQPFLPRNDPARRPWLNNFVDKLMNPLTGYATKYNILSSVVTRLDNGRIWVNWTFDDIIGMHDGSLQLTAFKDHFFNGGTGVLTAPLAPVFGPVPTVPLEAGIYTLASSVGQQIKATPQYAIPDGLDMGLEGSLLITPNATTISPDLSKSRLTTGGLPEAVWIKGHFSALKLMVDRGDGKGSVLLTISTGHSYIDHTKPAAGQSAIYTYTGIYMMNDQEFGQWSNPVSLTVRG